MGLVFAKMMERCEEKTEEGRGREASTQTEEGVEGCLDFPFPAGRGFHWSAAKEVVESEEWVRMLEGEEITTAIY